jgi:hypothetical protein
VSERAAASLAWGAAVLSLGLLALGLALGVESVYDVWLIPIAASFALVGALIASRRRSNPIGWLFLGFGLIAAVDFAAYEYAYRSLVSHPGSLPGGDVAASIAAHWWRAAFGLVVVGLLLFPNGRPLNARWRWVVGLAAATYLGLFVSGIFESSYEFDDRAGIDIPADPLFHGPVDDVASVAFRVLLMVGLAPLVAAGVSLVLRLRRSRGEQRQQVKVFVCTVAFVAFCFLVSLFVLDHAYGVLLFPLIPASAAVAILKYRLWDIDVVVNRTLVYGALTATLAIVYLGTVLLWQLVLSPSSDLAVAASTLAVAALFRPARSRIQETVDRRFYRRRYDAARILERFGARLRDQVELDALAVDLRDVVVETVHPAHVSLWLREAGR